MKEKHTSKLIVRRNTKGEMVIAVENHRGAKIKITGVAKVHFVSEAEPELVVTFRCSDIDADVEISDSIAKQILKHSQPSDSELTDSELIG